MRFANSSGAPPPLGYDLDLRPSRITLFDWDQYLACALDRSSKQMGVVYRATSTMVERGARVCVGSGCGSSDPGSAMSCGATCAVSSN